MPKELIRQSPGAKNARAKLSKVCEDDVLISVDSLYESFGEKPPLPMNKKDAEILATLVEAIGFGLTPDVRFHNQKPMPNGQVAIFPNGHGSDFQPSREYRMLGAIVRLGAIVGHTDGDFSMTEAKVLQSLIDENSELTQVEKISLRAFLRWCLNTPQEITGIKQQLAQVSLAEKTAISHILISVALADGRIDPKEVKHLEKIYSTLGLDKKQVAGDLHTLTAENGPVTVAHKDTVPSFSIPKPLDSPLKPTGFSLNEELIKIRLEETKQVKSVLEEIFSNQEEEPEIDTTTPASNETNPLANLDQVHQNFFHRLIQKETWERRELHDLCKELGLMPDGAMEILNEWALEEASAPLLEDGDPIFIDLALAKEIVNA